MQKKKKKKKEVRLILDSAATYPYSDSNKLKVCSPDVAFAPIEYSNRSYIELQKVSWIANLQLVIVDESQPLNQPISILFCSLKIQAFVFFL